MKLELSNREQKVIDLVSKVADDLKLPTYLVGGFVRDNILKRPTKDIDFVSIGEGSGVQLAQELANRIGKKDKVHVFKKYGTAMLRVEGIELEFVGARKESYDLSSRNPVVENGTLEDDQNRRDFTINALAYGISGADKGVLLDPFQGVEDIQKGIIRTPKDPNKTFSDDPLRMLRGIRFANQLNYRIDDQTLQGIKDSAHRISIISKERMSEEINKILMTERPSIGFKLMEMTGILKIIFPDFVALKGVDFKNGIGHKDNFYHTLQVVDNLCETSKDLWLRWAAVLHDIAKPPTKRFHSKAGWTFHGHEALGAKMVPKIFKQFKLPLNEKMKFVQKMVLLHLRPIALVKEEVSDSAVRRLIFDAGEDIWPLMDLCEADITSKNEEKVAKYLKNFKLVRKKIVEVEERDKVRDFQPPVTGEMIMSIFGLKPCKEIGIIKTKIKDAILDGEIKNDKDEAKSLMFKLASELGLEPQKSE